MLSPHSRRLPVSRLAGLCFALWALGGVASPARAQGRPRATLTSFGVLTDVRRTLGGGAIVPVQRGLGLQPGNVLQTDPRGRAEALLDDGTQMKVNVQTELQVLPTRARPIKVLRGRVFLRARSELRISTPIADCHVHGTELHVDVADDGTTTLTVVEGEVQFSDPQGSVVVRDGLQSVAREGQPPTTPGPAVNLPNIIQWTNDVQPVALVLETSFVSQNPDRLAEAQRQAEALPPGPERTRRLLEVRHDRGELEAGKSSRGLSELLEAYRSALVTAAHASEQALFQARIGQVLLEMGNWQAAETAFGESLRANDRETAAHIGMVMVYLTRRGEGDAGRALEAGQRASASDPRSPVAHTARALALIRAGSRAEAQPELQSALQLDPSYAQALAWQSFLFRTAERLDEALATARRAAREAPYSSLASQALSDALFARNLPREARKEAERAIALNPLSSGARVSLGRALLQEGRLDQAAPEAFRAVALDPSLDRAHFFLGLVLWEQRRLAQAVAEFARARDLDPGYLEARAYLARAYLAQGRRQEALAETRAARDQALPPGAAEDERMAPVHAALGRVFYAAAQLRQAAAEYRTALTLARGPAPLYEIELARVYLEQNDLPDALEMGLRAVSHAPHSHEAHSLLGLVYDRRSSPEQALREYREALSLYPDDALARLGLGTSAPGGGQRVREVRRVVKNQPDVSYSTADTGDSLREVAQAMLRVPAVLADIFKPGVTTEIAPLVGSQSTYGLGFTHRDQYRRGDLHDLSFANREGDQNYRNDRSEKRTFGWANLAGAPTYRSHALGQFLFTSRDVAMPGALASPTPNARSAFSEASWDLSGRHEWAGGSSAWIHAGYRYSHASDQDPDTLQDRFALLTTPTVLSHTQRSQLGAELRLDHRWGGGHTTTYVLFAGRNRLENPQIGYTRATRQLDNIQKIFVRDQLVAHTFQHAYHPGGRLSIVAGATAQRFTGRFRTQKPGELILRSPDTAESRWLPYAEATYVLTARDLVRLIGHRRSQRGFEPLLQPAEAYLVDEFPSLEVGSKATNYELDFEHRFSPRIFTKLFLFTGHLSDLIVVPAVTQTTNPYLFAGPNGVQAYSVGFVVPKARIRGIGLRYEHQVGRFLSSSLRFTYREFTDETSQPNPNTPAPGRQIPLNPRRHAVLGLNYIDRAGTKLFLEADWSDGLYQGVDRLSPWGKRPAQTVVNFRWAKESSVRRELAFSVGNLFNTGTIYWPGFPAPRRTYRLQYYFRF